MAVKSRHWYTKSEKIRDEIHETHSRTQFVRPQKVKVKLSLCFFITEQHTMKSYWGSGGTDPRILDLSTRWRWVVSFTPRPLYYQDKNSWYPLDSRLGGFQSRSGHGVRRKVPRPLSGLEPPIIRPVAQRNTTELSRLHRINEDTLEEIKVDPV
jgi:hypothetical protein